MLLIWQPVVGYGHFNSFPSCPRYSTSQPSPYFLCGKLCRWLNGECVSPCGKPVVLLRSHFLTEGAERTWQLVLWFFSHRLFVSLWRYMEICGTMSVENYSIGEVWLEGRIQVICVLFHWNDSFNSVCVKEKCAFKKEIFEVVFLKIPGFGGQPLNCLVNGGVTSSRMFKRKLDAMFRL